MMGTKPKVKDSAGVPYSQELACYMKGTEAVGVTNVSWEG